MVKAYEIGSTFKGKEMNCLSQVTDINQHIFKKIHFWSPKSLVN